MWCPICERETDVACEISCPKYYMLDLDAEDVLAYERWKGEADNELQDN